MENEFIKCWKNIVEKEITKLTDALPKVKLGKQSIVDAWKNNRQSIQKQSKQINIPDREWKVDCSISFEKSGKRAKLWHNKDLKGQVGIIQLPIAEPAPNWCTWIPIQRNLMPEKAVPTNIPYFGDEVIEKDKNFIVSLEEEVNHLNIDSLGDDKFLSLVEAVNNHKDGNGGYNTVLYHPSSKMETQYCSETANNSSLPRLIVFQAIHACYPEFGSVERLIIRYKNLNKSTQKDKFAPDIDGDDEADLTAEETLHTFKSLLCRRCFLYDCPLHKDDPEVDIPLQRSNTRGLPLPSEPCAFKCYMKNPASGGMLSPRTPMSQRDKDKYEVLENLYSAENREAINNFLEGHKTKVGEWTNAEKCLYRVFIKTYPGNFCAVAKALGTKSCEEVYHFSVLEGNTSRGDRKLKSLKVISKFGKTQQAQLYKHTQQGTKENKSPYVPCNHPGTDCSPDTCSCLENYNFCEKYCYCSITCRNRFPGCRCKGNCKTKMCPCFLASRECDPDLCRNCLDGKLELNPETNSCQNVHLQRFLGKKLHVAPSDIAGMGCFIGEVAEKGEFVAEYVGEMINQDECESRGRVYDKSKMSYMFTLNDEYILDAARFGGIIRFANHSSKPNCQVKILLVNGDHRIGIYAKQRIEKGEELFFDYGKDFVGHDLI